MRRASGLGLRLFPPTAFLFVLILAWQAITVWRRIPEYLLPSPVAIGQAVITERDSLWSNAVPTAQIAVLGFSLALTLGVVLAFILYSSRLAEKVLYPLILASQTVPIVALAPVLILLLGFSIVPKLIVVCLICILPIIVNTLDGLNAVDPDLIDLMRSLGATRRRRFLDVELPATLPFLLSGAKVAVTYSVVGALFGEWVGSFEGLGYLMIQQQHSFDAAGLFASMAVLALLGIGLFALVVLAERLLVPWRHASKS